MHASFGFFTNKPTGPLAGGRSVFSSPIGEQTKSWRSTKTGTEVSPSQVCAPPSVPFIGQMVDSLCRISVAVSRSCAEMADASKPAKPFARPVRASHKRRRGASSSSITGGHPYTKSLMTAGPFSSLTAYPVLLDLLYPRWAISIRRIGGTVPFTAFRSHDSNLSHAYCAGVSSATRLSRTSSTRNTGWPTSSELPSGLSGMF